MEEENAPISITLVKPTSVDTPFPQNARNYTGREPKLPPPAYAPEEVAYAILFAAENPERDIYVGGAGKLMSSFNNLAPRMMDQYGESQAVAQQLRDERAHDVEGALHRPTRHAGEVRGHQPGLVLNHSLYTRASLHPVASAMVFAGVAAAASALFRNRNGRGASGPARYGQRQPNQPRRSLPY